MHTPGGPLKYSLEGLQFAIFAMKLTSDNRYIISVSNKFITFDVVTSDLARQVYPKVEGLMIGLEISPDNKFVAAFTNNDQTILLNTLISDFLVIDKPLKAEEIIQGLILLDSHLVIYGHLTYAVLDLKGNVLEKHEHGGEDRILKMRILTIFQDYSIITWSGYLNDPKMSLQTYKEKREISPLLHHSAIALNSSQTRAFVCDNDDNYPVSVYKIDGGQWTRERTFAENKDLVLMLDLSKTEDWCYATVLIGFKLWHVTEDKSQTLHLPRGVRNVCLLYTSDAADE